MLRIGLVVVLLVCLPLALASCKKVTGGGQMTCIDSWDKVGLYMDFDNNGSFDLGQGLNAGTQELDRCSFGFNAQPADDPETLDVHEAKGQMQFVDHTKGIVAHFASNDDSYWYYDATRDNDYASSFSGWLPEGVGQVEVDGQVFTINQGEFWALDGHWALVDRSVPANRTLYPTWPYRPILEEGFGDVLYVNVYYDDWNSNVAWIGVVEKGNLMVHKDRK